MIAFVFPGQGAQKVGMGKSLAEQFPECRRAFEEADAALDESLSGLCFEGPDEKLMLTENTQPAILAMSVAVWRLVDSRWPAIAATVARLATAVRTGDEDGAAATVAELEMLGPVRATALGGTPTVPAPDTVREEINELVHTLDGRTAPSP